MTRGCRGHRGLRAGGLRTIRRQVVRSLLATAASALWPAAAMGQVADSCAVELGDADFVGPSADLSRVLDLLEPRSGTSFLIRRVSDRPTFDACTAPRAIRALAEKLTLSAVPDRGAAVLPAYLRIIGNSGYPRDWNDGGQWGGSGLSAAVTVGALLRWGPVEAAIAPVFTADQNSSFETVDYPDPAYSRFIDRWRGRFIDLPQRFGLDSHYAISPGQSFLRLNASGLRAGFSTENLAWGPARRNPLLLSGTSEGFAHMFVESARPRDVWIGDAEYQFFVGRLSESDYFDHNPDNDHRALSGLVLTLRPRGLRGLYLGAARLHSQMWSGNTPAGDILIGPFAGLDPDSAGQPRDMQLFGLFMRWAASPGGLEVYGEWARQDSWKHWVRLFNAVEAPQAYSLGLQKVVRRGDNALRLSAEFSHLSDALAHADVGRWLTTFYASPYVVQGHTHRGQLLGAPIGPGSESQFLGADLFWSQGKSSLSVERVRYDDDAYYSVWGNHHGPHGHDTELSFRGSHLLATRIFSVEGELGYSFRYSRDLIGLGHVNFPDYPYLRETNVSLRLTGRWLPPPLRLDW